MRNTEGFVRIWRSIFGSFPGKPVVWQLAWIKLIQWANWGEAPRSVVFKEKEIKLKRGQLLTGLREISKATDMSESAVARFLKFCRSTERIRCDSGQTGILITIRNYSKWQDTNIPEIEKRCETGVRPVSDRCHKNEVNEVKEEKGSVASRPPAHVLFDIWNQHRGMLPKAMALSAARLKHCKLRWNENPNPKYWEKVVNRLSASQFCNGNNDRGWRADIDFLLRPDTHLRALEGKYDRNAATGPVPVKRPTLVFPWNKDSEQSE